MKLIISKRQVRSQFGSRSIQNNNKKTGLIWETTVRVLSRPDVRKFLNTVLKKDGGGNRLSGDAEL